MIAIPTFWRKELPPGPGGFKLLTAAANTGLGFHRVLWVKPLEPAFRTAFNIGGIAIKCLPAVGANYGSCCGRHDKLLMRLFFIHFITL